MSAYLFDCYFKCLEYFIGLGIAALARKKPSFEKA
jgi:hypothetical protein